MVKPIRESEFVDAYEQVLANIKQFNRELDEHNDDIVSKLSQFRQWYFIPQLDMFGPSKYIGYKEMNAAFYNQGRKLAGQTVSKDGRKTERILQQWFIKLDESSELESQVRAKLEKRLYPFGKTPNQKSQVHVPKC